MRDIRFTEAEWRFLAKFLSRRTKDPGLRFAGEERPLLGVLKKMTHVYRAEDRMHS